MFVTPLRFLCRYQAPKYSFSLFDNIFKKKQQQSQSNQQPNPKSSPKQPPKPKQQSNNQEVEEYDIFTRQKQTLRNIDYARLKQISKEIPDNLGKGGIQEIMFWADGVEDPEEIFKLVGSFNEQWNPELTPEMAENYKFREFSERVIKYSYLAKDFETLSKIAEFGVLYDIREDQLWNKLQEKLLSLLKNNLDLEIVCDILLKFVKMRQGDMIYYKVEDLASANLSQLTPSSTSKILYSMFERETGDINTLKVYLNHFVNLLDKATPHDVVLFSTFLPFIKVENKQEILDKLERKIIDEKLFKELDLMEVAVVTKSFGNQYGSDGFWREVENVILKRKELSVMEAQEVMYGPLNSYRLGSESAKRVADMILVHIDSLRATHLSELSKILYIYELDNEDTYQRIQGRVMEQLQDLEATPLQQLMNICKNYSITRHGSRDIYKLLEVVIMARMQEIKLNRKVFVGIYNIYNKSDLCSAEMIKEFGKYR